MEYDIDLLKIRIERLQAKPGDVAIVYFPPAYANDAIGSMGKTFAHMSDITDITFLLVPEDLRIEVLPSGDEVRVAVAEDKQDQ